MNILATAEVNILVTIGEKTYQLSLQDARKLKLQLDAAIKSVTPPSTNDAYWR